MRLEGRVLGCGLEVFDLGVLIVGYVSYYLLVSIKCKINAPIPIAPYSSLSAHSIYTPISRIPAF